MTVSKWRHRFAEDRLEGLADAPWPGAACTISDETVEAVVVDTLETAPADVTHWYTRGLADKHGISKATVAEIWQAFRLKPWPPRQLQGLTRPGPDRQIHDIVGLHLHPTQSLLRQRWQWVGSTGTAAWRYEPGGRRCAPIEMSSWVIDPQVGR